MINMIIKKKFPSLLWNRSSTLAAIGLLIMFGLNQPCNAQTHNQRWYQVELIVFARQVNDSQEHWPANIKLTYPSHWVELKDPATSSETAKGTSTQAETAAVDLSRDPYYLLPDADKKLRNHAESLRRDSRYRVLFHQAWRQFINNQNKAPALLIQGGNVYGNHYELEGSITLSVAQYLQVKTNLWFSQFEINAGQAPGEWPKLPKMPHKLRAELLASNPEQTTDVLSFDQQTSLNTPATRDSRSELNEPYLTKRVVLIKEDRRMRSNELHYLDHPLFGVIIQITPF